MLDGYRRVVVTGALGFIGRHVVERLLSLGKDVVAVDNASTGDRRALRPGARFVVADVRDPRQVTPAMAGAELVVHLAGNASGTRSVEDPRLDFETNAMGTFNVLEAAVSDGVRRIVYVSSASVYGVPRRFPIDEEHPTRPFVPYGASKLAGEVTSLALWRATGLPVVVARPFCVYGPGENPHVALVEVGRYLRWHLNHRPIQIVGDADKKTRDFVHVSDLVTALLLVAERAPAGDVINIGSGTEVSMRELADAVEAATSHSAVVDELSHVTDDTYRLVADISKLRALGFIARTPLNQGIRDLAAHLGEAPDLPTETTIFARGQQAER